MAKNIKCANCEYAQQDKNASEYSRKICGKCEKWENCEVCFGCKKRDNCKARESQKRKQSRDRRFETVCSQQTLTWKAIQCTNTDSEYHRSLLNVAPNGDKQSRITWSGCKEGVEA